MASTRAGAHGAATGSGAQAANGDRDARPAFDRDARFVAHAARSDFDGVERRVLERRSRMSTFPHPTRAVARSTRAMVTSPSALASATGLDVLRRGGNAVDAAIATNAVLTVVYPAMCSLGGDAFWLVYDPRERTVTAYNGSGAAPRAASAAAMREGGSTHMPYRDARSVTVPGAVRSWEDVLVAHGSRDFDELLAPAESYARNGWALADIHEAYFALHASMLRNDAEAARIYFDNGRPKKGSVVRNADLADSLGAIRRGGADAWYTGAIAEKIVATLRHHGSVMTLEDLASHKTETVPTVHAQWHDLELHAHPPNSQGATALMALGALGDAAVDESLWQHRAIEAIKRAFHRRDKTFGDPRFVNVPIERYLSPEGLREIRDAIDDERAFVEQTAVDQGDTVYISVVDEDGRCVSLIQSIYMGFGSGIIAEGTGAFLHNRGAYFNLIEGHPNELAGAKRPLHTLSPAIALRNGEPAIVYGTMGSDGQPQNQVQILHNFYERRMSIQQAIDAPRWLYGRVNVDEASTSLRIESRADPSLIASLAGKGHDVKIVGPYEHDMGHSHAIVIDREHGTLAGGADPRADSAALGL